MQNSRIFINGWAHIRWFCHITGAGLTLIPFIPPWEADIIIAKSAFLSLVIIPQFWTCPFRNIIMLLKMSSQHMLHTHIHKHTYTLYFMQFTFLQTEIIIKATVPCHTMSLYTNTHNHNLMMRDWFLLCYNPARWFWAQFLFGLSFVNHKMKAFTGWLLRSFLP